MIDALPLMAAWLAGLMLGAVFFGGLWWTITRGLPAGQPVLWFGASFAVRMSLTLCGFYWVGRGDWIRLLACLIGFSMARFLVARATRWLFPGDSACT